MAGSDGFVLEQHVGGEFAANNPQDDDIMSTLGPLRELQIDCYQKLQQASTMEVGVSSTNNDIDVEDIEEDPRMDLIEQSIATLQMAQRGIRNHKIPSSHEVSLECHRLLTVAYSLLREQRRKEAREDAIQNELHHQNQFFRGVEPARAVLDPSALTIQHHLMAQCLREKMEIDAAMIRQDESTSEQATIHSEFQSHASRARKIAVAALGNDHPFMLILEMQLDELSAPVSKKRKLDTK